MNYNLFIDECGDHGLSKLNPDFPLFLLCGIIISDKDYQMLRIKFNSIKANIWNSGNVVFHSRDIRKCEKEFKVLFDLELKSEFYKQLDNAIETSDFAIVSAAIRKDKYIQKYGRISDDVYEISLSFIVERAIFFIDTLNIKVDNFNIVIERRGRKEDKKLEEHFQKIMSRGTSFISRDRLSLYNLSIQFRSKRENINGLQLSDLIAYPIARYVLEPNRVNPSFEIFKDKFYSKNGKRYGLKIFP